MLLSSDMRTIRAIIGAAVIVASWSAYGQIQPATAEVVDAASNVLGPTHTYAGGAVIILEVDGYLVQANVLATHLASINPVYFATNDCTGQAFAAWSPTVIFPPSSIVTLSNSVYAGPPAPQQAVMTHSRLDSGVNGCQVAAVLRSDLVPVAFVRDLSPHFQPPFGVRAAAVPAALAAAPALNQGTIVFLAVALAFAALCLLRSSP
jgi:hypothetical protein